MHDKIYYVYIAWNIIKVNLTCKDDTCETEQMTDIQINWQICMLAIYYLFIFVKFPSKTLITHQSSI